MTEHELPVVERSRREFLRSVGAVGASVAAVGAGLVTPSALALPGDHGKAWAVPPDSPYAPFRMALQSYSLRKLDFQAMIDVHYDLEVKFVELWPGHLPADIEEGPLRRRFKAMRHNALKRIAYGVVEFTKDHARNRDIFEYAKKLNVFALTASPTPDSFDSLDRLVEKFGIAVAIHNHGPEDKRYGKPEQISKAIKNHHRLIGLCVDTGHFLRSGIDPVDVVKAFKGRVHAVHLKDVKQRGAKAKGKVGTVLGQGELELVPFLRELLKAGFHGGLALEYEEEADAPVPSIRKCLEVVRAAVRDVRPRPKKE